MKKIGILSMQRVANYGSFLQAYGLKKVIESIESDCKVEFVDYHVGKTIIEDKKTSSGKLKKAFMYLNGDGKLRDRLKFINHKRDFLKKYGHYLEINNERNYTPELDLLVIGSDEVFNCIQANPEVGFSPELFGANNNAKTLISYAASFGNTTLEKLKNYEVTDKVANFLEDFTALSVRDKNSVNMVKRLTNRDSFYHIDPVLLYDYMNECKKIPNNVAEHDYIIVYAYPGRINKEENKLIRAYAEANHKKIICFGGVQDCCDKFIDCSPFEVLAYFKHADGIITDTFHGTIFSIINKKQFITLVRKSYGNSYGNEEKLTDLLNRLNLGERIQYSLNNIAGLFNTKIDYVAVNEIIEKERINSKEYLSYYIKNEENQE